MRSRVGSLVVLQILLSAGAARAEEAPPVEVEIADDAETDFFSEPDEPKLVVQQAPKATVKEAAPTSTTNYGHNTWKSWWERSRGIDAGDVLFSYSAGGWGGGLYQGLSIGGMLSGVFGIRASVFAGGFDRDDGRHGGGWSKNRGDWDFFLGGKTIAPKFDDNAKVRGAILHQEDLVLDLHLGADQGFDIAPSVGLSHFGYHIECDGPNQEGGSGLLRTGVALTWVYKRFFAGADLGWYPVELFRYGVREESHGRIGFEDINVDDRFDKRRITLTGTLGLSL